MSAAAKQLHSGKLGRKLAKVEGDVHISDLVKSMPVTIMSGARRSELRGKASAAYELLLDQMHAHLHAQVKQAQESGEISIFTSVKSLDTYRAILDTLAKYSVGTTVEVSISDREALAIFVRTTAPFIAPEQFEPWRKALLQAFEAHAQGETVIDAEVIG